MLINRSNNLSATITEDLINMIHVDRTQRQYKTALTGALKIKT